MLISEKINNKEKVFNLEHWVIKFGASTACSLPALRVFREDPTPVTVSVTGAESDVGESRISKLFW